MNSRILVLIAAVMAIFNGCDDDSSGPSDNDALFPAGSSSFWIYNIISYNEDGSVKDERLDTLRVQHDTTLASEKYYMINFEFEDNGSYFVNRDDGAYVYYDLDEEYDIFLKYPAKAGEKYKAGEDSITVESVSSVVTVDAGKYTCYKYLAKGEDEGLVNSIDLYICPGVGIVVEDIKVASSSGGFLYRNRLELKSYSL